MSEASSAFEHKPHMYEPKQRQAGIISKTIQVKRIQVDLQEFGMLMSPDVPDLTPYMKFRKEYY
jgi:hypothetical protein